MFAEAFHSTNMGIHLTLEVNTSFNNSACDGLQYEIQFPEI
jgi:hypothetical protein